MHVVSNNADDFPVHTKMSVGQFRVSTAYIVTLYNQLVDYNELWMTAALSSSTDRRGGVRRRRLTATFTHNSK